MTTKDDSRFLTAKLSGTGRILPLFFCLSMEKASDFGSFSRSALDGESRDDSLLEVTMFGAVRFLLARRVIASLSNVSSYAFVAGHE